MIEPTLPRSTYLFEAIWQGAKVVILAIIMLIFGATAAEWLVTALMVAPLVGYVYVRNMQGYRKQAVERFEKAELEAAEKMFERAWIEPAEEICQKIDAECAPAEPEEPTITITREEAQKIQALMEWSKVVAEQHNELGDIATKQDEALNKQADAYKRLWQENRDLKNAVALRQGVAHNDPTCVDCFQPESVHRKWGCFSNGY